MDRPARKHKGDDKADLYIDLEGGLWSRTQNPGEWISFNGCNSISVPMYKIPPKTCLYNNSKKQWKLVIIMILDKIIM